MDLVIFFSIFIVLLIIFGGYVYYQDHKKSANPSKEKHA